MNKLLLQQISANAGRGTSIDHSFNLVKNIIRANVNKFTKYYSSYTQFAQTDHVLVRIIISLFNHYKGDDDLFDRFCKRATPFITGSHGLTSESNRGTLFEAMFYGKGIAEALVSVTESYSLGDDLMSQIPVRVITHPMSTVDMVFHDGLIASDEQGLAVIGINIPLLLAMYVRWLEEDNDGSPWTFISTVILPSMIYNHVDVALLNRMYLLSKGMPTGRVLNKYSVFTVRDDKRLDRVLMDQIGYLDKSGKQTNGIVGNIPTVFEDNAYEVFKPLALKETSQNAWVRFFASVRYIEFILLHLHEYKEESFRINVRRYILQSISNKNLRNGLPVYVRKEADEAIERILLLL